MKYVILDIIKKDIVFKLPFNIGTIQAVKKHRIIILTEDGDIDYEKSTLIRKKLYGFADMKNKDNTSSSYDINKKISIWYKSKMGRITNKNMFYIKLNRQLWKDH